MNKDDLPSVPPLRYAYVEKVSTNKPLAQEITLTKEKLKYLYTINSEAVFFTTIDKADFLIESGPESSQTDTALETKFELPEQLKCMFDRTAINISD